MPNPIQYQDLFGDSVNSGLQGLITQVGEVKNALVGMLAEVKKQAESMGAALSGTSSATKTDRDATSQYAAEIERLHKENEKLIKSIDTLKGQLNGLNKAKSSNKGQTDALLTSYASLQDLLQKTKVNLDDLALSEKARNQIAKNGQMANNSLGGSYNQLYAQYNLVKAALNAMTDSMRNSEKVGKVWEAEAARIMETMKDMQEATGKHTLSVGDYTKAFNGLNISTQQVLREMPTLANSFSQFFIAISNNVPIFVDNLKRVAKETGSWGKAMKGVLASIFSWQTALLALLTILPGLAKRISENRKETEEWAGEWDKFADAMEKVNKIQGETTVSAAKEVAELKTLYAVSQDTTRSLKSRNAAISQMQTKYPDYLGNISKESILNGNAASSYDKLTTALEKNAIARGYLDAIQKEASVYAELQVKRVDKEKERQDALTYSINEASKALNNYAQSTSEFAGVEALSLLGKKSPEAVDKEIAKIDEMANKSMETIKILTKLFNPEDLIGDGDGGGGGSSFEKAKDYYWTWLESIVNLYENEQMKEVMLNNLSYQKKIETYKKELAERKNLTKEQERYLTDIITNLEEERQQKRQEIIFKHYDETWKGIKERYARQADEEEVMEEDVSITGRYEKILAERATQILAQRVKLNEKVSENNYRQAKEEGKILKDSIKEKLEIEANYQRELLKMRFETGELTADQYAIELAKVQEKLDKGIASLNKRQKGKFNIWTMLFGHTETDENGNVSRVLTKEQEMFAKAFDESFSMAFKYMDEWMDKRMEMAKVAVEAAQKETEAAKQLYDWEQEARVNGYANNVEYARKEYEEKLRLEKEAIAEEQRLQKIQDSIDTANQISSLITATAELWKAHASIPLVGQALAIAATAAMWTAFGAAKIKASQVAKAKTYGDGMSEYLNYGGSHASGNDIDFGVDRNGRHRRVERGEMIGVINKRNVNKYGVNTITDIIDSLNKGTFENKFALADVVAPEMNADLYKLAFSGFERDMVDLGLVESSLKTLVEQGETKVVSIPGGRIEYKGNTKRIIRN